MFSGEYLLNSGTLNYTIGYAKTKIMKTAVIGCGDIAQIMHIPNVVENSNLELHALLDPDSHRLSVLGERYNVNHRFSDVDEMISEVGQQLEVAIICSPMHTHAEVGVPILDAGLHVLLEKPIAMTLADADELVSAADTNAIAMVGYMKRYSQAYQRTREAVSNLSEIDLVTAYDTDPNFHYILDEIYESVADDLSDEFIERSAAERQKQAMEAIDTDDPKIAGSYDFHLEHICHDVNLLRGLLGEVERIRYIDFYADGRYGTGVLEYADGTRCEITSGVGDRKWFEQSLRFDAPEGMVELEFPNPFIKHRVPKVGIKKGVEELHESVETPTLEDSFKRELRHFVNCINGNDEVRTTFEEARRDLALIIELFKRYLGHSTREDMEDV